MNRKARISKGKTMNPTFFVFCEGETEEVYIKFLRSVYRLPIQIIPKKSDSNISNQYIQRCKKEYDETPKDQTFLMFDLDVDGLLERLKKITDVTLLCSNPCVEFWFLLHYIDCSSELTTNDCIKKLLKIECSYSKAVLTEPLKQILLKNVSLAKDRSKKLPLYNNPSSSIYLLIEELEKVKRR